MVISSKLSERHNENLEMRFDCLARADGDDIDLRISLRLARADGDDIDLRISLHELAAGGSTSHQRTRLTKF